MRYVVVFGVIALHLVIAALHLGGWGYALLWPAGSFILLAIAYAGVGPRLLGKWPTGRIAWWALLAFAPAFLLLWTLWHLHRRGSREAPAHEVAPGVWLSRRPLVGEVPTEVALIVDLTAEFPVARGLTAGREYLLVATLDGLATRLPAFREGVERVAAFEGAVLIHCAAGHGRSATFAAAVLLRRGLARDPGEAEERLRKVRPGVRLNAGQRRLLQRFHEESVGGAVGPG